MSQDREPRYFDFIHQHEERLNLIYSRWEAQIANQTAANQSKTLVGKIKSHKKAALAGVAIAFGSVFLACQYGKKINSNHTVIASNSQKLELMTWELKDATADKKHMACMLNGDIYQIASGNSNYLTLAKEPRYFSAHPDTISVVRRSISTRQPDAYMRLNPDRDLLFGSVEHTNNTVQTTAQVIDLSKDPADLSGNKEAINNYTQVQENAIALHEELSQCFAHYDGLGAMSPFSELPYAD